jgi:uridylate kinase
LTVNKKREKTVKLVIKIGRYIFDGSFDTEKISTYVKLFRTLKRDFHKIVVVTGGGEDSRNYIRAARKLGGSEFICDVLGIGVSRLNALLFIAGLREDAYPEPPSTLEELRKAFEGGKIVIMGGLQPGQSTNAVAALAAEAIGANLLINATNIDGVYSADPKLNSKAQKLKVITTDKLLKMVLDGTLLAGRYELFDPIAIKIVGRSKIPARIIDGRKPDNIIRVIKGEDIGTLIQPS